MYRGRLFGADGIRGSVDRFPLTAAGIADLGCALADWLWARQTYPTILLGTDTRESGPRLKSMLINSLLRRGVSVVDAGVIPTPGLSYLLARKGFFCGGVMISASHNPLVENGLKFFDGYGCKLSDGDEQEIEDRFCAAGLTVERGAGGSLTSEPDYVRQYAAKLAADCREWDLGRIRLLVDCANGAASHVARMALELLHIPNALLNATPNGANINHNAGSEVVRQSPLRMLEQIRRMGKDIGIALDGDGDRVVVVDHTGMLFDGDMLLAAIGFQLHNVGELHGDTVVTTEAANLGLASFLCKHQVTTQLVKNGDKYVTEAILRQGLSLGGEQIGHVVIHDGRENVTGDGLRTAFFLLRYIAQNPGAVLRELAPGMHKYPQVKASVYIGRRTAVQAEQIAGLGEQLAALHQQIPDLLALTCRPASTEPLYRIMLEARGTPVTLLAQHAYLLGDTIQSYFKRLDLPILVLDCVTGGHVTRASVQ